MIYEKLLSSGRIVKYKATPGEVKQLIKVAQRDIAASKRNLEEDPDWAYTIA